MFNFFFWKVWTIACHIQIIGKGKKYLGYAKVWKVSLENTTTWKTKSLTFSLDLCAPTKFTQIAVLVASKMEQKSSMTDGVHQNGATGKNVKRYQPVKNACHEIQVVKAFHLKFKARLLDYSCSENFCRGI